MLTYVMGQQDHELTLYNFFSRFHIARKFINHLFNLKRISVNHALVNIDYIIQKDDILSIDFSDEIPVFPKSSPTLDVSIMFEDDHILILNKPQGLVIYDDQVKDTLTGRVQAYYHQLNYPFPVLPAHRIDVETSGIIIYAKHPLALSYLSHIFETRQIIKKYRAIVDCQTIENGVIDEPVKQDLHKKSMIVSKQGLDAKTIVKVIDTKNAYKKIELKIIGGRKHQIRVHLSSVGCPIVGDLLYEGSRHSRMLLHATEVTFIHPMTLEEVTYTTKEPF